VVLVRRIHVKHDTGRILEALSGSVEPELGFHYHLSSPGSKMNSLEGSGKK